MKKILSMILVFALAQGLCFAGAESATAMDEFFTQTTIMLDAYEQIYATRKDAIDAVRAFCDDPCYETLLNARIVCCAAMQSLIAAEPPSLALSDETYLELMLMGVETDLLETQFDAIPSATYISLTEMQMFETMLYTSAFQKDQQATINGWIEISQRAFSCDLKYDCALLNGLLQPVFDETRAMRLWNELPERCPVLATAQSDWLPDEEELMPVLIELSAEIEELATQRAPETLGRSAYFGDQYGNDVSESDIEILKNGAAEIPGLPTLAPLPSDWLNPQSACIVFVSYENETDTMPNSILLCDENVSRASFMEYAVTLESCGAEPDSIYISGTEAEFNFLIDNHPLNLHWNSDGAVTVCYNPQKLSLEAYAVIISRQ